MAEQRLPLTCPVHIHTTLDGGECEMCLLDELTHRFPLLTRMERAQPRSWTDRARANLLPAKALDRYLV